MRKKYSVYIVTMLIILVLMVSACEQETAPEPTMQPTTATESTEDGIVPLDTAILQILEDRKVAIDTQDYDLYMSVIGRNNQFLYNEQERWFQDLVK